MTDRERLIELINKTFAVQYEMRGLLTAPHTADYLLANGVIVPPCKVGDKLYIIAAISQEIVESVVIGLWMADGVFSILTIHGTILNESFGKTVFLTKEEAEQALKEREKV